VRRERANGTDTTPQQFLLLLLLSEPPHTTRLDSAKFFTRVVQTPFWPLPVVSSVCSSSALPRALTHTHTDSQFGLFSFLLLLSAEFLDLSRRLELTPIAPDIEKRLDRGIQEPVRF
jgi:hypothetical protein